MIEAKMESPVILKKLLDAIKELVSDANFECNEDGLKLQAMDNSHVALVSVDLKQEAFLQYRCDRPMPLGVNLASLTKVIKCAKDDDVVTLRATDDQDALHLTYEAKHTDRISEYEMKLMDIDADSLGIPDTEYDATVHLSSGEFQRIVKDLSQLGESVRIEVTKEGVRFSSEGESANGNVLLKQSGGGKIDRVGGGSSSKKDKVKKEEDAEVVEDDDDEDAPKAKSKTKVKKEKAADDDGDEEMEEDDGGSIKDGGDEKSGSEAEPEDEDEDEEEGGSGKKRKRADKANGSSKKKKTKTEAKAKGKGKKKDESDDEGDGGAVIHMNQHVNLTFSLKYLVNFAKSASLSRSVDLMMSNDVPLLVKFDFGNGSISYYLAPKIGDD